MPVHVTDAGDPVEVISIPKALRRADTYAFSALTPIPASLATATFEIPIDDADKLSVGKRLTIKFYFSSDGGITWDFANGTVWNSYGPDGLTVTDPAGNITINPNPKIQIPLSIRIGQRIQGEIRTEQDLSFGIKVAIR